MNLTPLEVEQAAISMAKACTGKEWTALPNEDLRNNFRKAVTSMAAIYQVPKKDDKAMEMFMKWVSVPIPRKQG